LALTCAGIHLGQEGQLAGQSASCPECLPSEACAALCAPRLRSQALSQGSAYCPVTAHLPACEKPLILPTVRRSRLPATAVHPLSQSGPCRGGPLCRLLSAGLTLSAVLLKLADAAGKIFCSPFKFTGGRRSPANTSANPFLRSPHALDLRCPLLAAAGDQWSEAMAKRASRSVMRQRQWQRCSRVNHRGSRPCLTRCCTT